MDEIEDLKLEYFGTDGYSVDLNRDITDEERGELMACRMSGDYSQRVIMRTIMLLGYLNNKAGDEDWIYNILRDHVEELLKVSGMKELQKWELTDGLKRAYQDYKPYFREKQPAIGAAWGMLDFATRDMQSSGFRHECQGCWRSFDNQKALSRCLNDGEGNCIVLDENNPDHLVLFEALQERFTYIYKVYINSVDYLPRLCSFCQDKEQFLGARLYDNAIREMAINRAARTGDFKGFTTVKEGNLWE